MTFENPGLVNFSKPVLSSDVLLDFYYNGKRALSFPLNNLYCYLQNQDDGQQAQSLVQGHKSS